MKARWRNVRILSVLLALLLLPDQEALAQNGEYQAMEGVASVQTAFDFRVGDAEVALGHLDLIHAMLEDPAMVRDGVQPEVVVVFIGPSVNLVSAEPGMTGAQVTNEIAEKISAMDADGVRFEICMTAAHAHDVAPETILPEIVQVGNGWISLIGYQQQGYSMIADF